MDLNAGQPIDGSTPLRSASPGVAELLSGDEGRAARPQYSLSTILNESPGRSHEKPERDPQNRCRAGAESVRESRSPFVGKVVVIRQSRDERSCSEADGP